MFLHPVFIFKFREEGGIARLVGQVTPNALSRD